MEVELVRALGVEMVDSIDALLKKVDVVLLLSIDGAAPEQAKPVFAARKPVFIDKWWRDAESTPSRSRAGQEQRDAAPVPACAMAAWPPCAAIPRSVRCGCDAFSLLARAASSRFLLVRCSRRGAAIHDHGNGLQDGDPRPRKARRRRRAGPTDASARSAARASAHDYGATVFGSKGIGTTRGFEGYEHLITEIVKFFKTGKAPVSAEETIEIMAFMEAADESKRQGGCPVSIESVMAKARAAAAK